MVQYEYKHLLLFIFREPAIILGVIMLSKLLSPIFITERFLQRIQRLVGFKLEGNMFTRVGEAEELIRTELYRLTAREAAAQLEVYGDYSRTLQYSPTVAALEWGNGVLRRVAKIRGPLVVLSGEDIKRNKVSGVGWQCGKGMEGMMVEAPYP